MFKERLSGVEWLSYWRKMVTGNVFTVNDTDSACGNIKTPKRKNDVDSMVFMPKGGVCVEINDILKCYEECGVLFPTFTLFLLLHSFRSLLFVTDFSIPKELPPQKRQAEVSHHLQHRRSHSRSAGNKVRQMEP